MLHQRSRLPVLLAAALLTAGSGRVLAQPAASPATAATSAESLQIEEARAFLRSATVIRSRHTKTGITRPRRVTLSDGRLEQDALFQTVDEHRQIERMQSGRVEIDFHDSYRYNIVAFELAVLLGMAEMVPVTVERVLFGERGSLSWWLDARWDERDRRKQKLRPPDGTRWRQQWDLARVFRELIEDTDRNQTNMLIGERWQLWMVDFTRAFRRSREPREPTSLRYCSRALLARLRTIDDEAIARAVGDHLRPRELEALLARRRAIVAHFDRLIAARGEERVLF